MTVLPFMRLPDTGRHEVRSLSGRATAAFTWLTPHRLDGESGLSAVYPHGAVFPVVRRTKGKKPRFTVNAATTGKDTLTMFDLVQDGYPVGLVHSRKACEIEVCDIPTYQVVHVLSYPREREDRAGMQRTVWQLECVPADLEAIGEVHTTSWWSVNNDYRSWFDVAKVGSWFSVRKGE